MRLFLRVHELFFNNSVSIQTDILLKKYTYRDFVSAMIPVSMETPPQIVLMALPTSLLLFLSVHFQGVDFRRGPQMTQMESGLKGFTADDA